MANGVKFAEYYSKKTPKKKSMPKKLVLSMLTFAREHGLMIHPFGIGYYVENYQMFGHCVCDKSRPVCPCPEAVKEVQQDGYCKCRLYWKDMAAFMKIQGWEDNSSQPCA